MNKEALKINGSIKKYLDDLSARKMTPGGGSVAALTAALGAGLNLMVINYSTKDASRERENAAFIVLKEKQEKSLKRLSSLVDEDCTVFTSLMNALKKDNDPQGEYKKAAEVPMEVCKESYESLEVTAFLMENSNRNLLTDVGCAAYQLYSAFFAAEFNVLINLKYIKDAEFVARINLELDQMRANVRSITTAICEYVTKDIKK